MMTAPTTAQNGGSLLLELLLALGILGISLTPILHTVHTVGKHTYALHLHARKTLALIKVRKLVTDSVERAHTRFGLATVRVHENPSKSPFLSVTSKRLAPLPDSQAISFLHLSAKSELRIITHEIFADRSARFTACVSGSLENSRHFMAVGVDSFRAVEASVKQQHVNKATCLSERAAHGTMSILPRAPFQGGVVQTEGRNFFAQTLVLYPIVKSFTVYLAKDNSLRYFSHTSFENQPLAYGVAAFSLHPRAENVFNFLVSMTLNPRSKSLLHAETILSIERSTNHSYLNHVL